MLFLVLYASNIFKYTCLQIVLVCTFFLDTKGAQKIKHGMIAPRIRAGQRLLIAYGADLWLSCFFG
jgi:hypothetical protein